MFRLGGCQRNEKSPSVITDRHQQRAHSHSHGPFTINSYRNGGHSFNFFTLNRNLARTVQHLESLKRQSERSFVLTVFSLSSDMLFI